MGSAAIQLFEVQATIDANGTIHYIPEPPFNVTERLALFVLTLQPGIGVTDLVFATTPFIWTSGTDLRPRTAPVAVQVTRESDRAATIMDFNVSESEMHFLPVIWLMIQTPSGGSWRYFLPTDPTIINHRDPPTPR